MATPTITLTNITSLCFWKDSGENGFLCQWYPVRFTAPAHPSAKLQEPMTFSSTEQYMMYHKAMTFRDQTIAEKIMGESDPRQQKALGRRVSGFNEIEWNKVREKIVEDGNWFKFTAARDQVKRQELKMLLLKTENRLLVESSPIDNIWGIGFNSAQAEANRIHWGLNLLGKALMKVRDRIREDAEKVGEGEVEVEVANNSPELREGIEHS